jgi:hypothetical protein
LNGVGPSILGTKTDSCLMRKLNSSSSNKNSRLCKITIAQQLTVCQKVGNTRIFASRLRPRTLS